MSAVLSFADKGLGDLQLPFQAQVQPQTGEANVHIPLPLTPGRDDFGPALGLGYLSSGGPSPWGLGWSLSGLSGISIRTHQQLPQYNGRDSYSFGGVDIIPTHIQQGQQTIHHTETQGDYQIFYYRHQQDQDHLRIERWVHQTTRQSHWRVRDAANTVSIYGRDPSGITQIRDPKEPQRIFSWLLEAQYDERGNVIQYEYIAENKDNVERQYPFEAKRLQQTQFAQRYIKRIQYGNTTPWGPDQVEPTNNDWLFSAVFDYGDHNDVGIPQIQPDRTWPVRQDPYSTYSTGFEVRTYRLCRRIFMFHNFSELPNSSAPIGTIELQYQASPIETVLDSITYTGYRDEQGQSWTKSLPPISCAYATPEQGDAMLPVEKSLNASLPRGFDEDIQWVDLYGEGLPGLLTQDDHAWFYQENMGGGRFSARQLVAQKPSCLSTEILLTDFDSNGNINVLVQKRDVIGYYEWNRFTKSWSPFQTLPAVPYQLLQEAHVEWQDLNNDGRPDLVLSLHDRFLWYPSKGKQGWAPPVEITKPVVHSAYSPGQRSQDAMLSYFFADMTGDGLLDLVHIQNGRVEYWPHMGYGQFGASVVMDNAPTFDFGEFFDPRRLRLVDINGSGTTDIIYLGRGEISTWYNANGNSLIEGTHFHSMPLFDAHADIRVLDLLGNGTSCLVWSSAAPHQHTAEIQYLPLTLNTPRRTLTSIENSLGLETSFTYSSSSNHYLRDKQSGRGWYTTTPTHKVVVDKHCSIDHITQSQLCQTYTYHDGCFDDKDRRFLGFGMVEVFDAEQLSQTNTPHDTPPSCVRTWYHNGTLQARQERTQEFYQGDSQHVILERPILDPNTQLTAPTAEEWDEAQRMLAGEQMRQEVYALDAQGQMVPHPYTISQSRHHVKRLQAAKNNERACFFVHVIESLQYDYEQQSSDPRVQHSMTLVVDEHGIPTRTASIAYPRRSSIPTHLSAQQDTLVTVQDLQITHIDTLQRRLLATPKEQKGFELRGLSVGSNGLISWSQAITEIDTALQTPLMPHESFPAAMTQATAQLRQHQRHYFWDAGQTAAAPLGQFGTPPLPHHSETACFTDTMITQALGTRVTSTMLQNDAGYVQDAQNIWWKKSGHSIFADASLFYHITQQISPDGAISTYTYDSYQLNVVETEDAYGNTNTGVIDYYNLQVMKMTDANDNISEVLYDPLGVIRVGTYQGEVLDENGQVQLYGNDLLSSYVRQTSEDVSTILTQPSTYLQQASNFFFYDLDCWRLQQLPPRSISLSREELVHDGEGNIITSSPLQLSVSYVDGFGRSLQSKRKVSPGMAVERDAQGDVIIDGNGQPQEAYTTERWQVSGHTVYNNKQQVVRQYEPFYSSLVSYEPDAVLQQYGQSSEMTYDPLGRLLRTDLPNGTFSKTEYGTWESKHFDPNDTIDDSLYKHNNYVVGGNDPIHKTIQHTLSHHNTPSITRFDPLGRAIEQVRVDASLVERRTQTQLDITGQPLQVTDAKGLVAFTYKYDMNGVVLHQQSMDAGERWQLIDTMGRSLYQWDGRGVRHTTTYDLLGRVSSVYVDNAMGYNHRISHILYGEDPFLTQAKEKNLRGRAAIVYDQTGNRTVQALTPDGKALRTSLQLCNEYKNTIDWTTPANVTMDTTTYHTHIKMDALGRPVQEALPDGSTRRYRYHQDGHLDDIRITTADGTLQDATFLQDISVNARGQRTAATLGNGVQLSYQYDPTTFRLTRKTSTRPDGSGGFDTLQDIEYTYDPVGNVTHLIDHAHLSPSGTPTHTLQTFGAKLICEYRYDALYQLNEATGRVHQALLQHDYRPKDLINPSNPSQLKGTRHLSFNNMQAVEDYTRKYEYDLNGNLQKVKHLGASKTWTNEFWISNTSNRSLPLKDASGITVSSPESRFDVNGNCAYLPHLAQMDWNHHNRLTRAVIIDRSGTGDPDDAEYYVYDGGGQRTRKVTERLVSGQVEITEKIYLNGCDIKRIYRPSTGTTLLERCTSKISDSGENIALLHSWTTDTMARETSNVGTLKIHYQLSNHLGSSSLELDHQANLISYEEYFPFGGTAFLAGSDTKEISLKDYRYSRKERDNATGFYYYGYRYYVSWMGRWLNPDPIGPKDGLNVYKFVHNNPMTLTDPNGLQSSPFNFGSPAQNKQMSAYPMGVQRLVSQMRPKAKKMWFQGKIPIGGSRGNYRAFTDRFRFAMWWSNAQDLGGNYFVYTNKLLSIKAASRSAGTARHNFAVQKGMPTKLKMPGQMPSAGSGDDGGGGATLKKKAEKPSTGTPGDPKGSAKQQSPNQADGKEASKNASDDNTQNPKDHHKGTTSPKQSGHSGTTGGTGSGAGGGTGSNTSNPTGKGTTTGGKTGYSTGTPYGNSTLNRDGTAQAKKNTPIPKSVSTPTHKSSRASVGTANTGHTRSKKLVSLDNQAINFKIDWQKWKVSPNKLTRHDLKYAYTSKYATSVMGNVKPGGLRKDPVRLSSFLRDFTPFVRITNRDNRLSTGEKFASFFVGFADAVLTPISLVLYPLTRTLSPIASFHKWLGNDPFFSTKSGYHGFGSFAGMFFDCGLTALVFGSVLKFAGGVLSRGKRALGWLKRSGDFVDEARQIGKTSINSFDPSKIPHNPKDFSLESKKFLASEQEVNELVSVLRAEGASTLQSRKIADAIENEKIILHILDDMRTSRNFSLMYFHTKGKANPDYVRAFRNKENIFLRKGHIYIDSSLVHEGTHILDHVAKGKYYYSNRWLNEFRAYKAQDEFLIAQGYNPDFANDAAIWKHVKAIYPATY